MANGEFSNYSFNAQLAEAAYADLGGIKDVDLDIYVLRLIRSGMSETQARQFVGVDGNNVLNGGGFELVNYYEDIDSGFAATLFRDRISGEYTYSIRGTEKTDIINDVVADLDLGLNGVATKQYMAMINHYLRLITDSITLVAQYEIEEVDNSPTPPLDPHIDLGGGDYLVLQQIGPALGLGAIDSTTNLNLTGHSLGGHLASAFALTFPQVTSQAFTYNGAGLNSGASDGFTQLLNLLIPELGLTPDDPNDSVVDRSTNIIAEPGIEVVPTVGDQIGSQHELFIEEGILSVQNHSISRLSESLAVYRLLEVIDITISEQKATDILETASNQAAESLEAIVNGLGDLFNQGNQVAINNSDNLYSRIDAIETFIISNPLNRTINSIKDFTSTAALAAAAISNVAVRYALMELNNFTIENDSTLYADTSLDIENFSANYLNDRAEFLRLKINLGENDSITNTVDFTEAVYRDITSGLDINNTNGNIGDPLSNESFFIFGKNTADIESLSGRNVNDRIYGLAGNDTLSGNNGDDYLEGGLGNDTILGGEGVDVLVGGVGEDTLTGGAGNDTLYSGQLDSNGVHVSDTDVDTLRGGAGTDTYHVGNGDIISDDDIGNSTIFFNGTLVSGIADFQSDNTYTLNGLTLTLNGGTLTIEESGVDPDSLTVQGFKKQDTGYLGITLDGDPEPGGTDIFDYDTIRQQEINAGFSVPDNQPDHIRFLDIFSKTLLGNLLESTHRDTGVKSTLTGTNFADYIFSGGDDDHIQGFDGSDFLDGSYGHDKIEGGAGDDLIVADGDRQRQGWVMGNVISSINDTWFFFTGHGVDRKLDFHIHRGGGWSGRVHDAASRIEGDDTIFGGEGSDWIYGMGGDDFILGEDGEDTIFGGSGNDYIDGGAESDYIIGDYATIVGDPEDLTFWGNNTIYGGGGNDILWGGALNDFISGGEGDDIIQTGFNNVSLLNEQDIAFGGTGNDTFLGGQGIDQLYGEEGDDNFHAGEGNDQLFGGSGEDILNGNEGNDILYGDDGDDLVYGNEGDDTLFGGSGDDELGGFDGNDKLYGGDGNDLLLANGDPNNPGGDPSSTNELYGGDGNDMIQGDEGDDIIDGGSGDDAIVGLGGNDTYLETSGIDNYEDIGGDDTYRILTNNEYGFIADSGGNDIVKFENGATSSSIQTQFIGNHLEIRFDENNRIVLSNWQGNPFIELFEFANGVLLPGAFITRANEINNIVTSASSGGLINGNPGVDVFSVSGSNNTLEGGADDDIYNLVTGSGSNTINDSEGGTYISFEVGVLPTDVTSAFVGDNTEIQVGTDKFVLDEASTNAVIGYLFSDGSILTNDDVLPDITPPTVDFDLPNISVLADQLAVVDIPLNTFVDYSGAVSISVFVDGTELVSGHGFNLGLEYDPTINALTGTPSLDQMGGYLIEVRGTDSSGNVATTSFGLNVLNPGQDSNGALADIDVVVGNQFVFTNPYGGGLQFGFDGAGGRATRISINNEPGLSGTQTPIFSLNSISDLDDGSANFPDWLTYDSASQTFSGTPAVDDVGFFTLNFAFIDSNFEIPPIYFEEFTVHIREDATAPMVSNLDDTIEFIDDQTNLFAIPSDAFVDPNSQALTYDVTLRDGSALPSWLIFNSTTNILSSNATGLITTENQGSSLIELTVSATDTDGFTSSSDLDVFVYAAGDAPQLDVIPTSKVIVEVGESGVVYWEEIFSGQGSATAPITISAQLSNGKPLPNWLAAHSEGLQGVPGINGDRLPGVHWGLGGFKFAPDQSDVGVYRVNVTATNAIGNSTTHLVTFYVSTDIEDTLEIINVGPGTTVIDGGGKHVINDNQDAEIILNYDDNDRRSSRITLGKGSSASLNWSSGGGGVRYEAQQIYGSSEADSYSVVANNKDSVSVNIFDSSITGAQNSLNIAGVKISSLKLGLGSFKLSFGGGFEIHLEDFDPDDVLGPRTIDTFEFEDGITLTYEELVARGFDIDGTNIGETLTGTNVVDRIRGLAGDDSIDAGEGDDTLTGGLGDDTYLINLGDGHDVIVEESGADTIKLGAGILQANVAGAQVGNDLVLTLDTDQTLTIQSWFLNDEHYIESLEFDDGTILSRIEIQSLVPELANNAPTVSTAISDQSTPEDALFSFQVPANTFADAGDTLTFSASLENENALPAWLTYDPVLNSFTGTPNNNDVGDYTVVVTATDSFGETVSDTFVLTVNNVNDAPLLQTSVVTQFANEDAAFNFTLPSDLFNEIDTGDTVSISAQLVGGGALPAWLSFDAATGTFSGTPVNDNVGSVFVELTASDTNSGVTTHAFTIEVINTNDPHTLDNPIADQTANVDSAFSFSIPGDTYADIDPFDAFSNVSQDAFILTYSATLSGGGALPAWLTFDANTAEFTGTPASGDLGTISVEVTATDFEGNAVVDTFDITVDNPVNSAPTLDNAIADQATDEDTVFNFVVPANTFSDPDAGDTLTYSATLSGGGALPSWLVFNPGLQAFSGAPTNDEVGSIDIEVTATDGGGLTTTDTFTLTVSNTNDAPILDNVVADQVATEDTAFTFVVPANTFSDPDVGDTLTYSATLVGGAALPSWLTFNAATQTFSGTPTNDEVGNIDVEVVATDSGILSASDVFTLTVNNTNDAPTLDNAIANQSTDEDAAFTFVVPANTFSDPDVGDTLTYSATLSGGGALPSWLTFNAVTRTFSGTPLNGDVGNIDVEVTATDGGSLTATDTFTLTVNNTNDVPTLDSAIADQVATEDAAFNFIVPANTFSDIDVGDTLNYSATLSGGGALPTWLTFNTTTQTFSGTPANGDVGTISIEVTATDESSASVADTFDIQVNADAGFIDLIGTSGNDTLIAPTQEKYHIQGLGGHDVLAGKDANDLIEGGSGDDDLYGEGGADTLEGGDDHDNLYGQAGDDILKGGNGWDNLDGGTGADQLIGGDGSDNYFVDNAGDTIVENSNEGFDDVTSTVSYTLPDHVEELYLEFNGANINATGNDIANVLEGNHANNVLMALGGDDTVYSGMGNDTADGGSGDDTVYGHEGDDILIGGIGDDDLYGDTGSDTYRFNIGDGDDWIYETNNPEVGDVDKIEYGTNIDEGDLWFVQAGDHLDIYTLGTSDKVRARNWYNQTNKRIEEIHTDNGMLLDDSDVQQLVDAMAAFGAPTNGEVTLTQTEQDQIDTAIAAAWQVA